MHDSRTWRQRTGVKTLSHPPTLLYFYGWSLNQSFQTPTFLFPDLEAMLNMMGSSLPFLIWAGSPGLVTW